MALLISINIIIWLNSSEDIFRVVIALFTFQEDYYLGSVDRGGACVAVVTHFISTIGRHVVIVGRVPELDSVLTGFGLTAQGTFSTRETETERQRHQVICGFKLVEQNEDQESGEAVMEGLSL